MFVLDPALTDLAVRCWPDGCPRGKTCCDSLTVEVSKREVRAIDGVMDEISGIMPGLREGRGCYASVFIEEEPPNLLIEPREDGSCPFLRRTRDHSLCSIHQLALATDRPVPSIKPAACRHWPVMLEQDGERIRVSVQPSASSIGCVAPRANLPRQPSVLEVYREEILEMCGAAIEPLLVRRLAADRRRQATAKGKTVLWFAQISLSQPQGLAGR